MKVLSAFLVTLGLGYAVSIGVGPVWAQTPAPPAVVSPKDASST